jgi:hypothetical protein
MKHNSHWWSEAKRVVAHEVGRFVLMFLYLWALFLLLVLDEDIILRQRGISFLLQGFKRRP